MGKSVPAEFTHFGMGKTMTHKVFGFRAGEAIRAAEKEAQRLEDMLSRFQPASDIARVNGSAGIRHEKITEEAFDVLSRAVDFSRKGHGFFNITIAPLTDLWDYKNAV